jgi:hypothetical protein
MTQPILCSQPGKLVLVSIMSNTFFGYLKLGVTKMGIDRAMMLTALSNLTKAPPALLSA